MDQSQGEVSQLRKEGEGGRRGKLAKGGEASFIRVHLPCQSFGQIIEAGYDGVGKETRERSRHGDQLGEGTYRRTRQ